jgi:hypothetical protein
LWAVEQFVKTDLQKLMGEDKAADTAVADETPADKLAVIPCAVLK